MITLLEMDKDRWARMMLHDTFRLGAKSSQEGSRTSGGVLGGMGQHGCPQLPRPISARTAVSLGSSKVSEHWKGFLPPLCLLDLCPAICPTIWLENLPASFCPPCWESQRHKHPEPGPLEHGDPLSFLASLGSDTSRAI